MRCLGADRSRVGYNDSAEMFDFLRRKRMISVKLRVKTKHHHQHLGTTEQAATPSLIVLRQGKSSPRQVRSFPNIRVAFAARDPGHVIAPYEARPQISSRKEGGMRKHEEVRGSSEGLVDTSDKHNGRVQSLRKTLASSSSSAIS